MDKSAIVSLSNLAENEYSAFLNQLKKLEVLQYPTKACENFLAKLEAEGKADLSAVKQIRRNALRSVQLSSNGKLEIDEIKARRLRLIQSLTPYFDWVNGAQTRRVPWSLIPTAERLAAEIIPDFKAILYCENKYNYRIVWCQNPTKELQRYCFVSLPRLHRINVLMHALIGHELFHPCCKKFTESLEKEVASEIADECKRAFPELKPETLFGHKELGRRNKMIMFAWERALHELLCDMFCAELFGPGALFAMRAYASLSDWKHPPALENNFYPPWQYRFEVVWRVAINKDALDELWSEISKHKDISDIAECFKAGLHTFSKDNALDSRGGFDFIQNLPDSITSRLLKIAYAEVDKIVPEAHQYALSRVAELPTKWSDQRVLEQVPKLVRRLLNAIPPNEIANITFDKNKRIGEYLPEPAELPAILIAGWMYQVYREYSTGKKKTKLLSYKTLSRLLLKACEDSEMLRCP